MSINLGSGRDTDVFPTHVPGSEHEINGSTPSLEGQGGNEKPWWRRKRAKLGAVVVGTLVAGVTISLANSSDDQAVENPALEADATVGETVSGLETAQQASLELGNNILTLLDSPSIVDDGTIGPSESVEVTAAYSDSSVKGTDIIGEITLTATTPIEDDGTHDTMTVIFDVLKGNSLTGTSDSDTIPSEELRLALKGPVELDSLSVMEDVDGSSAYLGDYRALKTKGSPEDPELYEVDIVEQSVRPGPVDQAVIDSYLATADRVMDKLEQAVTVQ